ARTFVDKPFHLRLNVEHVPVVERNKEQLEYRVLQSVAQGPVKQPAQSHKEEEIDESRGYATPFIIDQVTTNNRSDRKDTNHHGKDEERNPQSVVGNKAVVDKCLHDETQAVYRSREE